VPVDKTFTDWASGKDTSRVRLAAVLDFVREGDTVVVHSMDRLARDLNDLLGLVRGVVKRGMRSIRHGGIDFHRGGRAVRMCHDPRTPA
jgi:DNA invertase Pin-like site-specific DNA recombinase